MLDRQSFVGDFGEELWYMVHCKLYLYTFSFSIAQAMAFFPSGVGVDFGGGC